METCTGDIQRYKIFVAGHRFNEMDGKSGVLVLGRMGSCKSLTISVQLGAEFKKLEDGSMQLVRSKQRTPKTSDGWTSKTLQVQLYDDKKTGRLYLDTAGLNENRGQLYRDWTSFSTAMVFSLLKEIKAVIVMVDYAEAFGSRGEGLRQLADSLSTIVSEGDASDCIYESTIFVFINAFRNGTPLRLEMIMDTVKSFQQSEKDSYDENIRSVQDYYGKRSMESKLAVQIEWDRVPPVIKTQLKNQEKSCRLLDAMLQASQQGRCFCSCLSDEKSCIAQCKALGGMIDTTRKITKAQLDKLVAEREMKSLQVSNMLVSLLTHDFGAKSYLSTLKERADLVEQLITVCDRNRQQIDIIQNCSWKEVHDSFLHDKEKSRRSFEDKRAQCEKEKDRRATSQKLEVLKVDEIRLAKTSSLLSWTILGHGWAEMTYELEKVNKFEEYQLTGDHYTKKVVSCTPDNGKLKLLLTSEGGYGLNVDVKIMMKEKDLPSTKQSIQALSNQIKQHDDKVEAYGNEISILKGINNKEQLLNIAVAEKPKLEGELERISMDLKKPTEMVPEWTEGRVFDALTRLVPLLLETPGGISEDLASGPRAILMDFQRQCVRESSLKDVLMRNPTMKNYAGQGLEAVKHITVEHLEESDAPVRGLAGRMLEQSSQLGIQIAARVERSSQSMESFCREFPFLIGAVMLSFVYTLPSSVLGKIAGLLLMVVGLFLVMWRVTSYLDENATRAMNILTTFLERWGSCAEEAPRLMQNTMKDCGFRLAEQMQVNCRMDSSDFATKQDGGVSFVKLAGKFLGGFLLKN